MIMIVPVPVPVPVLMTVRVVMTVVVDVSHRASSRRAESRGIIAFPDDIKMFSG
jgi:hypothetical protein